MHALHMLFRRLVQGAIWIATEVAAKMMLEWCITFEAELTLVSKTIEKCLRIGCGDDEVVNTGADVFAVVVKPFHPCLGVSLANFPTFLLHDGSKLGCPVLSTFMKAVQCLDNKHRVPFELSELGASNEAEESRAMRLKTSVVK